VSCSKNYPFWEKQYNFDPMKEVCIAQGSVLTLFRCGGQVHNHLLHFSQNAAFYAYLILKFNCSFAEYNTI